MTMRARRVSVADSSPLPSTPCTRTSCDSPDEADLARASGRLTAVGLRRFYAPRGTTALTETADTPDSVDLLGARKLHPTPSVPDAENPAVTLDPTAPSSSRRPFVVGCPRPRATVVALMLAGVDRGPDAAQLCGTAWVRSSSPLHGDPSQDHAIPSGVSDHEVVPASVTRRRHGQPHTGRRHLQSGHTTASPAPSDRAPVAGRPSGRSRPLRPRPRHLCGAGTWQRLGDSVIALEAGRVVGSNRGRRVTARPVVGPACKGQTDLRRDTPNGFCSQDFRPR